MIVVRTMPSPAVDGEQLSCSLLQELTYCGMSISDVFSKDLQERVRSKGLPFCLQELRKQEIGIGGVLSLLWFRRQLPAALSECCTAG